MKVCMNKFQKTGFAERLKTASEARKALLAQLRPRPTVTDPDFQDRATRKQSEMARVRDERAEARAAAKLAAADRDEAVRAAQAVIKRAPRKARLQLTQAEAKAARDARYAARKAR
jgi:hypothetical protein